MIREKEITKIGVGRLCKLFGKTRQAFYDREWNNEERKLNERIALELVAEMRRELPGLGTHKLYLLMREPLLSHGVKMGRDKLHKLLLDNGLTIKKKSTGPRTTNSNHWLKKYPNLIKDLIVLESELLWVSDITYLYVGFNFNYLSLITDAYSKKIVGYYLHTHLDKSGPINALKMALSSRKKFLPALIHHSDRGVQYCSFDYVQILRESEISISMTQDKDPYENAIAERVNGILKTEFGLNKFFSNRDDAILAVCKSIEAYNFKRPHMSCDYLTPDEAHNMTGKLKRRWKDKIYKKERGGRNENLAIRIIKM